MKKILPSLLIATGLLGCVSVPIDKGRLQSDSDAKSTARLIYDTAKKCWEKENTFWSNGITVENRVELDGIVITAWYMRYHNVPIVEAAIITISEAGSGSTISVREAKIGNKNMNLASDIPRWLSGDQSCRTLKY